MIDIERDIDIFSEQKIEITRRVKDFSDITAKEGEFTRTFQGPASRKNQKALENYGILGTNSTFDPHKGISCIWSFSTFAKFTGRLEVVSVQYKDGKPYAFTFNFYGRQRSLANVFGADRFSDIDWSEFDHALTYDNVQGSWSNGLFGGILVYPLIDSRANYYFGPPGQNVEGNIRNENNPILLTDLKPAMRLPIFMQRLFSAYGLELSGYLVDSVLSEWRRAYILPNRWSGSGVAANTFNDNVASYEDANTPFLTDPETETIITFDSEIQDDNNLFDGTTYTANVNGEHTLSAAINTELDGTPNIGRYAIIVKVNGVEINSFAVNRDPDNPQLFYILIPQITFFLSASDEVEFFLRRENLVFGPITFFGQDAKVRSGNFVIQAPANQLGQTVSLNDQMPDDKIVEWLGSFVKSLNLVLIPDGLNETKWTIKSLRDYYEDGEQRDWKGFIDIENMTFDKPTVYKEIKMGYTATDAAVQRAFRDATDRDFGSIDIRPDVEFAKDKLEIKNPCTLIPPALFKVVDEAGVPTGEVADVVIHKSLNIEGNPVKEPWLLFYNNGITGSVYSYYLQNGFDGPNPTGQIRAIYPHISAADNINPNSDTATLCFSLESALNAQVPENTAYLRYWETELLIQYAPESRVLKNARVVLPTLQFYNYNLNDEIYLENTWWRIIEIAHDKDGKNAKVTLQSARKILPDNAKSVLPGGKINFTRPPNPLEKSAAGAYKKGASFYGSFVRAQVTPNLQKYGQVINNITQTFIEEINEIGGRFRSWEDDSPES